MYQNDYIDHVFHDTASVAGKGKRLDVKCFKELLVDIAGDGSNSARTVTFYGITPAGVQRAIAGMRTDITTPALALSTTGTGETWSFTITGYVSIIMELTSITGGTVTVKGRAVT